MRIDFKKVLFFGLVASMPCLAQETVSDSKEVTMCQPQGLTSDDCRGELIINSQPREDDYDYDVYTIGEGEETCKTHGNYCERSKHEKPKKSNCDNQCKRKGAAKVAQEN